MQKVSTADPRRSSSVRLSLREERSFRARERRPLRDCMLRSLTSALSLVPSRPGTGCRVPALRPGCHRQGASAVLDKGRLLPRAAREDGGYPGKFGPGVTALAAGRQERRRPGDPVSPSRSRSFESRAEGRQHRAELHPQLHDQRRAHGPRGRQPRRQVRHHHQERRSTSSRCRSTPRASDARRLRNDGKGRPTRRTPASASTP